MRYHMHGDKVCRHLPTAPISRSKQPPTPPATPRTHTANKLPNTVFSGRAETQANVSPPGAQATGILELAMADDVTTLTVHRTLSPLPTLASLPFSSIRILDLSKNSLVRSPLTGENCTPRRLCRTPRRALELIC